MLHDPTIRQFLYHLLSGNVFYSAIVLLTLLAVFRAIKPAGQRRSVLRRGIMFLGITAGVVALMLSLACMTVLWMVYLVQAVGFAGTKGFGRTLFGISACLILLACWFTAIRYETRTIVVDQSRPIVIYGDSLSVAYHVEESQTWPRQLAAYAPMAIDSRATAGYMVGDVLKQLDADTPRKATVVLAIGGNDTLAGTPLRKYHQQLQELLRRLIEAENDVIFLEAPAPPTAPWYAWTQRQTALQQDVPLLPKRVLLRAIFGDEATTVDDLHLSAKGHEIMASELARRLKIR